MVSVHLDRVNCFIVTHQIFEDEDGESAAYGFSGSAAAGKAALHGSTFAKPTARQVPTALSALPLAIRQTPYRYLSYFFRSVLNIRRASGVEPVSSKIADHRDKTPRQKPRNERPIFLAIFRLNPEAIAIICSPLPGGVGWRAN
jgi:hypothetical protein